MQYFYRSILISAQRNVSYNSKDFYLVSRLILDRKRIPHSPVVNWFLILSNTKNVSGDNTTTRFGAHITRGNGCFVGNPVAILCIPRWFYVLPPLKYHLSPLLLPFTPFEHSLVANGLCWHRHNDHHLIFPSNLLYLPMWTSLAIYLPWWCHCTGNVHYSNTTFSITIDRKVSFFSSLPLLFHGTLWPYPSSPRNICQLEQPQARHDFGLRVCHGYILLDWNRVLRQQVSREIEAWMVRPNRTQPSSFSCFCGIRSLGSLWCHTFILGVSQSCWMWSKSTTCTIEIHQYVLLWSLFVFDSFRWEIYSFVRILT